MLRALPLGLAMLVAALLAACARSPEAPAPVVDRAPPAAKPSATPAAASPAASAATARAPAPAAAAVAPMRRARGWDEFKLLAARRVVELNPQLTYAGPVREPLLAVPVLDIELNADGSVRRIDVLRRPRQATDTVQIAIAAIHRAAPFSDVSRLPRPWRFTEAFLFDDSRRFKPRTLDEP